MVRNIFSLLSSRQNSILSGAFVLMATVFASKILGLVKLRLLAHYFTEEQIAVFMAAFKFPDFVFNTLIFGAISIAFIPVFTDYLHKKGEQEAFDFASDILNSVLFGFTVISIVLIFFARPIINLVVPGFSPDEKELTASLSQIILLGQILLAIGAFFSGLAQTYQRFLVPALAAVFYNVGIILGTVFLSKPLGLYGPVLGVIMGASLHVIVQLPLVSLLGFTHKIRSGIARDGIKEVANMMSMRTIGVAVEQLNEIVGVVLASLISTASVTYLTFAQSLQTVPIGLFGLTLAQAAMPVLSREKAQNEDALFKSTFLTTMHQILFLALPAAAILIVLRVQAVRLVFGSYQYDWSATITTGMTLALLALGLSAQSIIILLIRAFYALKDTRTPVLASIVSVTLNVTLSYLFVSVFRLDVWSIGLSYAISTNLSFVLLLYFLDKKLGGFNPNDLILPAVKMLIAAVVSAIVLYVIMRGLDQMIDTTRTINLVLLTGIATALGSAIYLVLVWLMKVRELTTYIDLLKKIYNASFKVKSEELLRETGAV